MSWFVAYMAGWGAWVFGGSSWLHYKDVKREYSRYEINDHVMLGIAGCLWPLAAPGVALYHLARAGVNLSLKAAAEIRAVAEAEVAYRKLVLEQRAREVEAEAAEKKRVLDSTVEELVETEMRRREARTGFSFGEPIDDLAFRRRLAEFGAVSAKEKT